MAQGTLESMGGRFRNKGLTIRYRAIGKGAPLLLLNGGPGFSASYLLAVAQELGDSNACILLEQRGTSRTMPITVDSGTVSVSLYLSELEALRKHLRLDRWAVLGHSFGAFLAMKYMTEHPIRISAAILVGTNPPAREMRQGLRDSLSVRMTHNEAPKLAALERSMVEQKSDRAFLEYFQFVLPYYFFDRERGRAFAAALKPEEVCYHTFARLSQDTAKYDLRDALRRLKNPVLILHGWQDILDLMMLYEVHLAISTSSLELLEKCGHFPWLEQPAEFYAAVRNFLKRAAR